MARNDLPGCFHQRGERWYWTTKLPGETKFRQIALKPHGSDQATKDEGTAREVALDIFQAAKRRQQNSGDTSWDGTVGSLVLRYREFSKTYYVNEDGSHTTQVHTIRYATDPLIEKYAMLPVEDFGPAKLMEVRDAWCTQCLARSTVNDRVWAIKNAFSWAASRELIPAYVAMGLQTVKSLRQGRSKAVEPKKVTPVAPEVVRATKEAMTKVQADMVEIHMLTRMRSSEVCYLAPKYLDRSKPNLWVYSVPPEANKNNWRGQKHDRKVPIVPHVQQILLPYLLRSPDAYCFSPMESELQRHQMMRQKRVSGMDKNGTVSSGKARDRKPKTRTYTDQYDATSYRKFVFYAVKKINKERLAAVKSRLGPKATAQQIIEEQAKVEIPHWHPHQLRHTAATLVRNALGDGGLDAARALLGQKSLGIADVYAEIEAAKAVQAAGATKQAAAI